MKFIKENWHLFIPIGLLLSPFYMAFVRRCFASADFELNNQEVATTCIMTSAIIGIIHLGKWMNKTNPSNERY